MDALASVALGGKAFVATLNKPWRQSLRGRIGEALGTPWEALGTRSSFVVRRRSFVTRLSQNLDFAFVEQEIWANPNSTKPQSLKASKSRVASVGIAKRNQLRNFGEPRIFGVGGFKIF